MATRVLNIKMSEHDEQVSKVSEIGVLEELFDFFKDRDLYLTSLFRPDFIDWATCAIENDVAPDIWADRMYHMQQTKDAEAKVHNLRAAIETLEDEIKTRDERIDDVFIAKDERIRGLEQQIDTHEQTDAIYADNLRSRDEQLFAVRSKLLDVHALTLRQEDEINKLKARLWDYHIEELHDGSA